MKKHRGIYDNLLKTNGKAEENLEKIRIIQEKPKENFRIYAFLLQAYAAYAARRGLTC